VSKLSISEISQLIADKIPVEQIAEQSGWSAESIRRIASSNIHKEEVSVTMEIAALEYAISERLEAEQNHIYGERHFTDSGWDEHSIESLYAREEGDPEELDFNDY